MSGEYIFTAFCVVWLALGGALLIVRAIRAAGMVQSVRDAKRAEERVISIVEAQVDGRLEQVRDMEERTARKAEEARVLRERRARIEQSPSPLITIASRDQPRNSEALWIAPMVGRTTLAGGARFMGAWGDDAAFARSKMIVALGEGNDIALGEVSTFSRVKMRLFP